MTHGFGAEARNYRHGHKLATGASPEYVAWTNMKKRCNDPKNNRYHLYGAKGVKVHSEWMEDFATFLAAVGPRPSPEHSLDRYPNKEGNYEAGNVRWATDVEQSNNRRNNRMLTYNAETRTMAEWSRIVGIDQRTIHARLGYGWSVEKALTTPIRPVEQ